MEQIAQGDVFLMRIARVEGELTEKPRPRKDRLTLAYGESTGHHHSIYDPSAKLLEPKTTCHYFLDNGEEVRIDVRGLVIGVLEIPNATELVHGADLGDRPDHGPHSLAPGKYLMLLQRERSFSDVQGYRRAAD
jgi:hypothetical protein